MRVQGFRGRDRVKVQGLFAQGLEFRVLGVGSWTKGTMLGVEALGFQAYGYLM